MTYLKQMYTTPLNSVDNLYWQHHNELILLQWFLNFTIFVFIYILSVLSSNLFVSDVKKLTQCPVLILNLFLL